MLLQRAWVAESRAENSISNGPLRVQTKAKLSTLQRKAYVSCRGYVGILLSVWRKLQIKVAPRIMPLFALDRIFFCQGLFYLPKGGKNDSTQL